MRRGRREQPTVDLNPLTGRLVSLREFREEDLRPLVTWWNDPAVAAYQRLYSQPMAAEGVMEIVRSWNHNKGSDCGLCIVRRKGGELVGHVAVSGATPKDRCATLAIVVGPEYQNRGYGTEALRLMLRYAFLELGLHRVELGVFGFNERAIATYRKAGFQEEGRRRQAIWRSGQWHDDVLMGILRDDWLALPELA